MEKRTLYVIVISAQELKRVKNFGQQSCYAVAYIYPHQKKTTKVDYDGGLNPAWNAKLALTCEESVLQRGGSFITVDIYSRCCFFKKLVGTVSIPIQDVLNESKCEPKLMAFEVRRPSGKVNGVMNLSVMLGEKKYVDCDVQNHSSDPEGHKKQQKRHEAAPMVGYPEEYKDGGDWPTSNPTETYPPSLRSKIDTTYPPTRTGHGSSVNPPAQRTESSSTSPPGAHLGPSSSPVYPPPNTTQISKIQEPVMAYLATGYPAVYPPQQYPPLLYAPHYASLQDYPTTTVSAPYNYQQQVYYSKPPKKCREKGLLGGALGGLLLGDMIGDLVGFYDI